MDVSILLGIVASLFLGQHISDAYHQLCGQFADHLVRGRVLCDPADYVERFAYLHGNRWWAQRVPVLLEKHVGARDGDRDDGDVLLQRDAYRAGLALPSAPRSRLRVPSG